MEYQKQEFIDWEVDKNGKVLVKGTVLTAEHLRHIEEGIVQICSEMENLGVKTQGIAEKGTYLKVNKTENGRVTEVVTKDLDIEIAQLNAKVAELMYEPIVISSFKNNVGTVEIGSAIQSVVLSWAFNKTPKSVTLDGVNVEPGDTPKTITFENGLKSNKTWTLVATDEKGTTQATTGVSFLNGVYYGVMEDGAKIDSAAILAMMPKPILRNSHVSSFKVNAGAAQRYVYAFPARAPFGTPTFKDAETGFQASFYQLEEPIQFTNASGYEEPYNVWLSTNPGLGSMTVLVG